MLCSGLFVKHCRTHEAPSCEIAGPSNVGEIKSKSTVIKVDKVMAFQCGTWPKCAYEWVHRHRKYIWPSPKLVNFIKSKGWNFVPVGKYNSRSPFSHEFLLCLPNVF